MKPVHTLHPSSSSSNPSPPETDAAASRRRKVVRALARRRPATGIVVLEYGLRYAADGLRRIANGSLLFAASGLISVYLVFASSGGGCGVRRVEQLQDAPRPVQHIVHPLPSSRPDEDIC